MIFIFAKFVAIKISMTTNLVLPVSFDVGFGSGIRDPVFGMGKNKGDLGSGINIPDLHHWQNPPLNPPPPNFLTPDP
jgi:hypothetical protein